MSRFKNLMSGIWYGEAQNINFSYLRELILNTSNEKELILNLLETFKLGNFSLKGLLIQLMNQTEDEAVLNLCIRTFSSISTTDDLREINNFKFLENASDSSIRTFVSCATEMLSYEVVPYLLALLEEWDEFEDVKIAIKDALYWIIGFETTLDEEVTPDEIGNYYLTHIEDIDLDKYYYMEKLSFPGELCKSLIERATLSLHNHESLKIFSIPSLLSIWSGKKCPISYNTLVNDELYKDTLSFVKVISEMGWIKGKKYFYGHSVD